MTTKTHEQYISDVHRAVGAVGEAFHAASDYLISIGRIADAGRLMAVQHVVYRETGFLISAAQAPASDAPAAAAKSDAPAKPRCRSHEDVTPGTLCPRCGSKVRAPRAAAQTVIPGGGAPAPAGK